MTYWRGVEGRLLNFLKIFSRILKSFWRFGSPWNFLNRSIYSLRYHFWTLWFGLSQKCIIHLILKITGSISDSHDCATHWWNFWNHSIRNWTVRLTKNGRSTIKLDGPRKWMVVKYRRNFEQKLDCPKSRNLMAISDDIRRPWNKVDGLFGWKFWDFYGSYSWVDQKCLHSAIKWLS